MMNDVAGVKAIDGLCGGSTGTMDNCAVNGEIVGAIIPGAVAGRAENSVIESREASVTPNGDSLTWGDRRNPDHVRKPGPGRGRARRASANKSMGACEMNAGSHIYMTAGRWPCLPP